MKRVIWALFCVSLVSPSGSAYYEISRRIFVDSVSYTQDGIPCRVVVNNSDVTINVQRIENSAETVGDLLLPGCGLCCIRSCAFCDIICIKSLDGRVIQIHDFNGRSCGIASDCLLEQIIQDGQSHEDGLYHLWHSKEVFDRRYFSSFE